MNEVPARDQVQESSFAKGQLIMPFYIVCDCSASMQHDLPALQSDLQALVADIAADAVAADTTMLSIITFGSSADTAVPLSAPESIQVPSLGVMGATSFGSALAEYNRAFNEDYARLKKEGSKVFRPCVFFLTDGQATDNWEGDFQRLLAWDPRTRSGNALYPYIVAYGYRDADAESLKKLAYPNFGEKLGKWFLTRSNNVHELLQSMIGTIGQTIVSSGQSVPTGHPQLNLPPAVATPGTLAGEPDVLP